MNYIDEVSDLEGKTVLVRAGLNVPVENGVVVNDFRIKKALPTIEYLQNAGARVLIISHIGRSPTETLRSVFDELKKHIEVAFATDMSFVPEALQENGVVLLENLRQDSREKENDEHFAQEIAELADIFVQDDFSTCHREHASIIGLPKLLPSYGGLLLKAEIGGLQSALSPEHPSLAVLGGAKFETKEPLVRKLLEIYDAVFVGGALANELLASQGHEVGRSVVEDKKVAQEITGHEKLMPISDVIVVDENENERIAPADAVQENETIVDIGPATMNEVVRRARDAQTLVWNGPLGWYERGYTKASITLADAIAENEDTQNGVCKSHAIIGGGDTIAILDERVHHACTFVSTGGGAMLTFLEKGTLVGIEALQ